MQSAASAGNPIKLVIPVHYAGQSVDFDTLIKLKNKYSFHIIEDASHALGAQYSDGKTVGSSILSDMTTISFHPVKHIATGEGGVVLTNNAVLYEKLKQLRSHGIVKEVSRYKDLAAAICPVSKKPNPWYYEMQDLGYNYRIPDINAALGYSQALKFPRFLKRRREIAKAYDELLKTNPYFKPFESHKYGVSAYHLYVISLADKIVRREKARFIDELISRGVGTQVHYIPVTSLPYYKDLGFKTPPAASEFYEHCLSIPMYPAMKDGDIQKVIDTMNQVAQSIIHSPG